MCINIEPQISDRTYGRSTPDIHATSVIKGKEWLQGAPIQTSDRTYGRSTPIFCTYTHDSLLTLSDHVTHRTTKKVHEMEQIDSNIIMV